MDAPLGGGLEHALRSRLVVTLTRQRLSYSKRPQAGNAPSKCRLGWNVLRRKPAQHQQRRWSSRGVAGAFVLAAWAGLFWFLWFTGREAFYLSTRTDWVVPVAAVLLTVATIGRLASARVVAPRPLSARELWIMGLMVVPVVLVLFAPVTTLGTFSAGKRAGFSGTGFATSSADIGSGELTLVDVASAETSPEGERALAKRAGETVRFVGFVSIRDDTPADEFLLARYVVSCCVADATIAEVRVVNVTPGQFANEDWVEVTGTI